MCYDNKMCNKIKLKKKTHVKARFIIVLVTELLAR